MAANNHLTGLSELFHSGWEIQKKTESSELTATSKNFSETVSNAISQLEEGTRLVNQLGLFSKNETVEEISTNDLKYILLPALLGHLVSQLMDGDRCAILERAQVYFIDFLQRCSDYAITKEEVPRPCTNSDPTSDVGSDRPRPQTTPKSMEQLASIRRDKITRLKAKKQIESTLKELDHVIKSCDSGRPVDEEIVREHTLTLLNLWVYKALDNIGSIQQELELLEQMERFKEGNGRPAGDSGIRPHDDRGPRPPMKPFVITKDMLKNQVFGAGYPSLPTMSVEEFYQQRYQNMPKPQQQSEIRKLEDDDGQEETEEEEKERLTKEREFDEFKDVNRRGWGNRKNKG